MPSNRETFFELQSFAVIGSTALKPPFPRLTYNNLRRAGRKVFAVDVSGSGRVEGQQAYASLAELPEPVEGAIIELPKAEALSAARQVADAGIKDLWVHMSCDTPELLELCAEKGINVRHGTCAVMYTQQGFSFHSLHKWVMKLSKQY